MRVLPDNMARKRHHHTPSLLVTTLLCMFLHVTLVSSDAIALLRFKESLRNDTALTSTWREGSTPPCKANKSNWVGIHCRKGKVRGLKLENMGLHGVVDVDSLLSLPSLRSISVMNNRFSGPLPELRKLGALKSVYLSNNNFSGLVDSDAFAGMAWLKKLHLAHNHLTGNIPLSLTSLPKLLELRLEDNQFVGRIPNFQQKSFRSFNVSNNYLSGSIPANLSGINASSFSGNDELCGNPLGQCKQTSVLSVVVVVIILGLAIVSIGAVFFILNHRNQQPSSSVESPLPSNLQKKPGVKESDNQSRQGSPDHPGGGKAETPKLSFVRDDRERFDMQDLLRSSAEILGSGCFESSYKACLPNGQMMVVKRFKQMNNVGKEEFQEYMKRLGKLRHPNLLPLVAYYYRKEEKLLVSDYVHKGSLAVHLHGHQGLGLPSLDWAIRLKIVKGIARGLKHIYNELPSLITPHGHLKSSNVLLDESLKPLLTDYSLIPVMNQEYAHELMVAYKSPEYMQHGRITKKTDVWSLGILILEILTGKFPASILQQGKGNEEDSPFSWVTLVVPEGWIHIDEVFDKEMAAGSKSSEGEMRKLLKIGLACCEGDVEKRWDFKEAFERIEELRENDGDDDFYTSYASEADIDSSRRLSADFNLSTTGSVQIF